MATWITARHVVYSATGKPISVTDADSRVTTTAYDDLDRVLTMTDPILRKVHYEYCTLANANCAALALRVEKRGWGSPIEPYATYTYTLNGKQASVADGEGHVTSYAYDGHDRLWQTTFPDSSTEKFGYDRTGNIVERRTRANEAILYSYNAANWPQTKTVPSPGGVVTTWTYDLAGRLEQIGDTAGYVINPVYTANKAFRLTSVVRTVPGLAGTQTVAYDYDAAGNRPSSPGRAAILCNTRSIR